jgi:iron(III) transport system ATP-binding protein
MAELRVAGLTKTFGEVRAVDDVTFTVQDGEFVTLLGPSGCGKSTTLAAIAGLDRPDAGLIALGERVFFDGGRGTFVPPERREIGLVFQSYALWPHMTVVENLEFPLKLRKVAKAERAERIREVLELVEMVEYAGRYPHMLSGGQQQRVALARTLVYRPRLLLLDEPLSNLDAKLRERARTWLRHLQHRVGVTTVYVTHDQSEALALSDRIAVMSRGKIVQLADPYTVYERPADPFVADFIGSSNFFQGRAIAVSDGLVRIALDAGPALTASSALSIRPGSAVTVSIRPERIRLVERPGGGDTDLTNVYEVRIEERTFLGAHHALLVRLGEHPLRVACDLAPSGDTAFVQIPAESCILFPAANRR